MNEIKKKYLIYYSRFSKILTNNNNNNLKALSKYNRLIKTNFFERITSGERSKDFFFRKHEYEKAHKFLSDEMKDISSILVYCKKFRSFYNFIEKRDIIRLVHLNLFSLFMFNLGIYDISIIWFMGNIYMLTKFAFIKFKNTKKISSIFLIKSNNDFTKETDFYFVIGYGAKKVEIINLMNFSNDIRLKIEKNLHFLDEEMLVTIGFGYDYKYFNGEKILFNKDIFKYFFKQEEYQSLLKKIRTEYQDIV